MNQDFEKEYLQEVIYLQAAKLKEEIEIMKEIMEEEYRLPAKINVINKLQHDELENNALSF